MCGRSERAHRGGRTRGNEREGSASWRLFIYYYVLSANEPRGCACPARMQTVAIGNCTRCVPTSQTLQCTRDALAENICGLHRVKQAEQRPVATALCMLWALAAASAPLLRCKREGLPLLYALALSRRCALPRHRQNSRRSRARKARARTLCGALNL